MKWFAAFAGFDIWPNKKYFINIVVTRTAFFWHSVT